MLACPRLSNQTHRSLPPDFEGGWSPQWLSPRLCWGLPVFNCLYRISQSGAGGSVILGRLPQVESDTKVGATGCVKCSQKLLFLHAYDALEFSSAAGNRTHDWSCLFESAGVDGLLVIGQQVEL